MSSVADLAEPEASSRFPFARQYRHLKGGLAPCFMFMTLYA
jgi:hypothetical protein